MNRKVSIWFVVMVAMFLMPVGLAESGSQFAFMDTITWDSTPEEVESVLGDGVERKEDTDESIGTFAMLLTESESYAGYKCGRMTFMYYNDQLYSIACFYTESEIKDTDGLIEELTKIYGAPHMNESNQYSLEDFINGNKTMCDWSIDDDTNIEVVGCNDHSIFPQQEEEYPYLCFISFENIPVSKQFEEAMQTWAANNKTEPEK